MKKSNVELMQSARESLNEKWGLAIITFLIYQLIIGGMQAREDMFPYTTIIFLILAGPFSVGISIFTLNLSRNSEARFEQLFDGFKKNMGNSIIAYFLMVLFIILWTLLLIIPGIIAAISYSMIFFIIADDETISPMDALDKSKKMMNGYKWKYFRLGLRLFGLALLCILTLGIGFLWLIPYAHVSCAKFYEDIKVKSIIIE
ncbi:MAG: hypothetical protein COB01_07540 [Lutibacter sp.]|nr:MAG: hypothetical protein COB01_07540 [Lutibacter sp.]